MPYLPHIRQTWEDNNLTYPASAARFTVIENGVYNAHYKPVVRTSKTVNQTIGGATNTTVQFEAETVDTDSMHSTSSNIGRLTATVDGKYSVSGFVSWAANATGQRRLRLILNNAVALVSENMNAVGGSLTTDICLPATAVALVVGDFISLEAWQNSGGNLDILSGATFSAVYLSAA